MDRLFCLLLAVIVAPAGAYASIGSGCASADPDFLCLGLKYVVYDETPDGPPIIGPRTVERNIDAVNEIWGQCRIGFQVEELIAADPAQAGLPVETANFPDLDRIRATLDESSRLLVVTTRPWDRRGTLGASPANAWTKMPGSGVHGIVLEGKVGAFPNILAHELGHYLNLYHTSEAVQRHELMNAVIFGSSNVITGEQCRTARAAALEWWSGAIRRDPQELRPPAPFSRFLSVRGPHPGR